MDGSGRTADACRDIVRAASGSGLDTRRSAAYHRAVASVLMPLGMARLYVAEAEGSPVSAAIMAR